MSVWTCKGFSDGLINPVISSNSFASALSYVGTKARVKFDWSCLKQDKITFIHGKSVNIYITFKINL